MKTAVKVGIGILVVVVLVAIGGAYAVNMIYHHTFCQGWKKDILNENKSLTDESSSDAFDAFNSAVNNYNAQCSTF